MNLFSPSVQIGIVAIDDFGEDPKVLHIQQRCYFNFMFRPKPFYIRIKIFWTRMQFATELYDAMKDGSIWQPATLEIGSIHGNRSDQNTA